MSTGPGEKTGNAPGQSQATGITQYSWPEFDGEALIQVRVKAEADRLRLVRKVVHSASAWAGCSEPCTRDIVIAVDEACQNVIRHAYGDSSAGELVLDIRRDDDSIVFNLVDFAPPVDVSQIGPRDLDDLRPGGLGTHFIKECMDEVSYAAAPPGAGNRLMMKRRIG